MDEIRHMTSSQFRRSKRMIRRLCANYDGGSCLLLEENFEPCPCPQLLTYSLVCKYSRAAVLCCWQYGLGTAQGEGQKYPRR